ncbi:MAG: hypothetical protein M1337_00650 [Actinobacteria bacterium]|nr:hypothetical protein [Actinomycetota bacterium]MCL5025507.1 hypothetical protein [Chloroflexota bacterium]
MISITTKRSRLLMMTGACIVVAVALLFWPTPSAALPNYAAATGQACGTCHVNPGGGGPRNDFGQAFEAIPTHADDPAGAFAQASGASAPPAPSDQNGASAAPPASPDQDASAPEPAPSDQGGPAPDAGASDAGAPDSQ